MQLTIFLVLEDITKYMRNSGVVEIKRLGGYASEIISEFGPGTQDFRVISSSVLLLQISNGCL